MVCTANIVLHVALQMLHVWMWLKAALQLQHNWGPGPGCTLVCIVDLNVLSASREVIGQLP